MQTLNRLRFPSGITVEQAKKDARSLAKAENIKLSTAQDLVAKRNQLDMRWGKAIEWIKANRNIIGTLRLPLANGQSHLIDLSKTSGTSVAIIAGPGRGKTHLARDLAVQHLEANPKTQLIYTSPLIHPDDPHRNKTIDALLGTLIVRYPGRIRLLPFDNLKDQPSDDAGKDTLVVYDDTDLIEGFSGMVKQLVSSHRKGGTPLILCGMTESALFLDQEPPAGLAAILRGPCSEAHRGYLQFPTSDALYELPWSAGPGEFAAASLTTPWTGVVKITS